MVSAEVMIECGMTLLMVGRFNIIEVVVTIIVWAGIIGLGYLVFQ